MLKLNKHYFSIFLITVISTLVFWLIFSLNIPSLFGLPLVNLKTLFANYDGPNYLVISKCGYNFDCIRSTFSLGLPLEYYPAHLIGFPLTIKILNIFFLGPLAMLLSTLIGSVFLNIYSYKFFSTFIQKKQALFLTIVFNFLPARLFVLRNVGAPETWFIGFIIASLYHFKNKNYLLSALFLSLAQVFKTPAILLLASYFIYFIYDFNQSKDRLSLVKQYLPFLLAPISVILIFWLYYVQTGDFWAYFNSGDNRHLFPVPFGVFTSNSSWVNGIWLEDIIFIFIVAYYTGFKLFKKYKFQPVGTFILIYTIATTLVVHRDISRYITPIYPLVFIALVKQLTSPAFKKVFYIIIFAVYLYSINFCLGNTAPVADWTPYL